MASEIHISVLKDPIIDIMLEKARGNLFLSLGLFELLQNGEMLDMSLRGDKCIAHPTDKALELFYKAMGL